MCGSCWLGYCLVLVVSSKAECHGCLVMVSCSWPQRNLAAFLYELVWIRGDSLLPCRGGVAVLLPSPGVALIALLSMSVE